MASGNSNAHSRLTMSVSIRKPQSLGYSFSRYYHCVAICFLTRYTGHVSVGSLFQIRGDFSNFRSCKQLIFSNKKKKYSARIKHTPQEYCKIYDNDNLESTCWKKMFKVADVTRDTFTKYAPTWWNDPTPSDRFYRSGN